MDIVLILAPLSLFLGAVGLCAFWWTLRTGQYEDPRETPSASCSNRMRIVLPERASRCSKPLYSAPDPP